MLWPRSEKLVGAQEELKAWGNCKKDGLFSKVMGKSVDDFDEFLALQQISEKRKELEHLDPIHSKPRKWNKFNNFETKMRGQRNKTAEAR